MGIDFVTFQYPFLLPEKQFRPENIPMVKYSYDKKAV